MSTRSYIGYSNGKNVNVVYCHHDGTLNFNGKLLDEYYDSLDKVKKLISDGGFSSLEKETKDIRYYKDEHSGIIKYNSVDELITEFKREKEKYNFNEIKFVYIFNKNKWYYLDSNDAVLKFKDLKKELIKLGIKQKEDKRSKDNIEEIENYKTAINWALAELGKLYQNREKFDSKYLTDEFNKISITFLKGLNKSKNGSQISDGKHIFSAAKKDDKNMYLNEFILGEDGKIKEVIMTSKTENNGIKQIRITDKMEYVNKKLNRAPNLFKEKVNNSIDLSERIKRGK